MKRLLQLFGILILVLTLLSGCQPRNVKTGYPTIPPISQPPTITLMTPPLPAVPVSGLEPSTPAEIKTKYGIIYEGQVIPDNRVLAERSEFFNGLLQLVVFHVDNLIGDGDRRVALYDLGNRNVRFIADQPTSAGDDFWTGWLRKDAFFIANNSNLVTYGTDGTKKQIYDFTNAKMNTIHGVSWSQATQTMAVLLCDRDTDDIDLVLLDRYMHPTKRLKNVDRRERFRGPSGAFPWEISVMAWDYSGERLAFTKTAKRSLAVYDRSTDAIQDVEGVSGVDMIRYDVVSKCFLTLRP